MICKIVGSEFCSNKGYRVIIVNALYGLKISGKACQAITVHTLHDLGYQPTRGVNGVWIKLMTRPDGRGYYALVLICVDDILCINHDTKNFMNKI